MAIHVALHHLTHYRYDRPVMHSPHTIRLRPAPHCRTPILSYSLKIIPENHFLNWQQDPLSNYLARVTFPEKTREFKVEVDLVVEMAVFNPFDFFLEPSAEQFPFIYADDLKKELGVYLETSPAEPLLDGYLKAISREPVKTIDFLVAINQLVQKDIRYLIRMEPGVQDPETTLGLRSGSCRDSAWLAVQIFRRLGLAARFVSGYLIQLKPDTKSLDGPSGAETDFTDLHAWVEVFLPGAGWIGLDPTSGLLAGEGHIPLACSPEPHGAAPITGNVDKCETTFSHEMSLKRIFESPRVTKPYTESQWAEIQALGHKVDEDLRRNDVRLTMGGEPTFIAIDNMDGEEWNFTAVGPEKKRLSGELLLRLRQKFAPGGFLHHGQGKWYPGEQLPRWAFSCYWRNDGVKIWQDETLLANESKNYGHTEKDAEHFIKRLAQLLGVDAGHILSAHEDTWYYLWREKQLPINVDPLQSKLADKQERERLAHVFQQGLNKTTGYVLPLMHEEGHWKSGQWFLRREHLFLIPGDSAIGLRLPLDSTPWVATKDQTHVISLDPTEAQPPLPQISPPASGETKQLAAIGEKEKPPGIGESAVGLVRTALCAEAREGKLHIFIPPLSRTEQYLELLQTIEKTAAELQLPVIIEGSPPPHDGRLRHFKVTPDPGVIEINLQPARNWDELVNNTVTLYEEARQTRLGAEKFMIDGRHVGTGGGNHIVIGGETPADSPLLRRPNLLASLLRFWQNHPSLSFLFSGLFIGPTSQHPRVDEARNDSLYELEIACAQIPKKGTPPPWLVDRIFRNLLTDVTGNTHRAEFSIDKLYSPDTSSGRLGLLELRAFEMPPHERMSLAQQLLLRSLVARFWNAPYEQKFVHWGTQLHDRFMMPHFIWQDFEEVIDDLRQHGYAMKAEWFSPHWEFRFPFYGSIAQHGVEVEVRQALEPWHVLGEEGAAAGAVRYVDSSVERLQIRARGLTDTRHLITCNGRKLPLHSTGVNGEFVAAVRFRAWQPPQCLHPTIGVHSPLTFDIVDSWNQRSLGGCVYHVAHPGGRNYQTLPVNSYEAESRRLSRFFKIGHTGGKIVPPEEPANRNFPLTLDLRTEAKR